MFRLIIILTIFLIASCANPERLRSHYGVVGGKCVSIGKNMEAVEACLGLEFRESIYRDKIVKDHQTCKPYWGFPFVRSCGGIKIIYSQQKTVIEWLSWGQFDGV